MPRKIIPKLCECGCGEMTKGGHFIPGHDSKLLSSIIQHVGGLKNLKIIVEDYTQKGVVVIDTLRDKSKVLNKTSKFICPECSHQFKGGSWSGIDAHWKSKHEHIMPYEKAWSQIRSGTYKKVLR